jgi:hypothetical protein
LRLCGPSGGAEFACGPVGYSGASSRKSRAVWGRFGVILRTKIDKNRQKSMKNDEDFEVDLLIAKELRRKLRLQSGKNHSTAYFGAGERAPGTHKRAAVAASA